MAVAPFLLQSKRRDEESRQLLAPTEFETHKGQPINKCRFAYNDSVIVTCSDDKSIGFWDSHNGGCLNTLTGHRHCIKDMSLNEKRNHLLTVSWDKSAILWDYTTGQQIWTIDNDALLTCCDMDQSLVVIGSENNQFHIHDLRTSNCLNRSKRKKGHSDTLTCTKISNDGYSLCTTSMDRTALVWDLRMLRRLLTLRGHTNTVSSCAFSHNDHFICTSSWDKTLRLYDVHSGTYRKKSLLLKGHDGSINSCCFSSNDTTLLSCGCDQFLMLWNTRNLESIGALKGGSNESWFKDIHLSQDNKTALTCSKNGMVKLWDLEAVTKFYKKQNTGMNITKCSQCGCPFSSATDLHCLPKVLCVFCRLASQERSVESIVVSSIRE